MFSLKSLGISLLICIGYMCIVSAKGQGWDGVFPSLLAVALIAGSIELSKK